MTMGEYIKMLRIDHEWTQEELGKKLSPPVNRAAVNKWETGQVENIKRNHIAQLSKLFGVTPCQLMCFEERDDQELTKALEVIRRRFGKDAVNLLTGYDQLNETGRQKILEDLSDLKQLSKYTDSFEKELSGKQAI